MPIDGFGKRENDSFDDGLVDTDAFPRGSIEPTLDESDVSRPIDGDTQGQDVEPRLDVTDDEHRFGFPLF